MRPRRSKQPPVPKASALQVMIQAADPSIAARGSYPSPAAPWIAAATLSMKVAQGCGWSLLGTPEAYLEPMLTHRGWTWTWEGEDIWSWTFLDGCSHRRSSWRYRTVCLTSSSKDSPQGNRCMVLAPPSNPMQSPKRPPGPLPMGDLHEAPSRPSCSRTLQPCVRRSTQDTTSPQGTQSPEGRSGEGQGQSPRREESDWREKVALPDPSW